MAHIVGQVVPEPADESRISGVQSILGAQSPSVFALEKERVFPYDGHCVERRVTIVRFVVDYRYDSHARRSRSTCTGVDYRAGRSDRGPGLGGGGGCGRGGRGSGGGGGGCRGVWTVR